MATQRNQSSSLRAIVHASELYTGEGYIKKNGRRLSDSDMGKIPDGALVYSVKNVGALEVPDTIHWVGASRDLPSKYAKVRAISLKGQRCVTAGFVDCHTHLVFSGDRSEEFALRCGGMSYAQIAAQGGGIQTTVKATRAATLKDLLELASKRVEEAMRLGTRVIEIKSGYGLDSETEIKQLKVARELKKRFPQLEFSTTYLGAHAVPSGQSRQAYVDDLIKKELPTLAKNRLADACDIFVDSGYFESSDAERLLLAAKKLGLGVKIHADELGNTESAALAARLKAWSADHLLCISKKGIQELARSETVAVLLPTTAFYLKASHAPARKLLDAGAQVALASDFNPGTSMTLNLPFALTLGALYLGMSRSELLAAVTFNAACALRKQEQLGTLTVGKRALFTVHPFARFEELYYRFGWQN
jgi:imidazolonepropionase